MTTELERKFELLERKFEQALSQLQSDVDLLRDEAKKLVDEELASHEDEARHDVDFGRSSTSTQEIRVNIIKNHEKNIGTPRRKSKILAPWAPPNNFWQLPCNSFASQSCLEHVSTTSRVPSVKFDMQ